MRTYRRSHKKNISRKNKKGGFISFLNKPSVVPSGECSVNNLSSLTKMPGVNDSDGNLKPIDERLDDLNNMLTTLQTNYSKCCPKGFMGRKNSSQYCNQLDTTFTSIKQHKNDISGYYGDEKNVSKIKETMNSPMVADTSPYYNKPKPWYQFWGGKKRTYKLYKKRFYKRATYRKK